jgi:hypothetical protein
VQQRKELAVAQSSFSGVGKWTNDYKETLKQPALSHSRLRSPQDANNFTHSVNQPVESSYPQAVVDHEFWAHR